jgi:hypothetical protein
MTLAEFITLVPSFEALTHTEKIKIFAWHLHTQDWLDRFDHAAIRKCYDMLHLASPELSTYFRRMVERKPSELLKDARGYRLEGAIRKRLDDRFGQHPTAVVVSKLLTDLPAKVPNIAERAFLAEALACYKAGAFRATIVMTWNLAFDHLLSWIFNDPGRLANFNASIAVRYPKRKGVSVSRAEHFEEFRESEIIEVCNTAGLFSRNIVKILNEKLTRRNIAADPSLVHVTQHQADDVITDLVNNVVLRLI